MAFLQVAKDYLGRLFGEPAKTAEIERLRNVEKMLRESEERYRQLFEASSDWFWEQDSNGYVTFVSERHGEVTGGRTMKDDGLRRDEFGDTSLDPEAWRGYLAAVAARRPFRDFVYRHRLPDAD